MNKQSGTTFLEVVISFTIILIVINPIYSGVIELKRAINKASVYSTIENDMEKARVFYKRNRVDKKMKTLDSKTKISIDKKQIDRNLFIIKIRLENNSIERESEIYVYR